MHTKKLITLLDSKVTSTRENRGKIATIILNDQQLFFPLLEISLDADNPVSVKAAWVLEYVLKQKLEWLSPYLNYFTEHLSKSYRGSAVRSLTKICEFLANIYTHKTSLYWKNKLTSARIESIIEVSFDRLISEHKVAVKVYAMETLFLLGKNKDWVHNELKLIIQQEIVHGSHAYKARGKRTLHRIQKLEEQ
jgi:hypothetical protein